MIRMVTFFRLLAVSTDSGCSSGQNCTVDPWSQGPWEEVVIGDMCWGSVGLTPPLGLHHFFLLISRPGPSRTASPPGPGEETAPAHLPGPREQCSPCCLQPSGPTSPLMHGSSTAAQMAKTHTLLPFQHVCGEKAGLRWGCLRRLCSPSFPLCPSLSRHPSSVHFCTRSQPYTFPRPLLPYAPGQFLLPYLSATRTLATGREIFLSKPAARRWCQEQAEAAMSPHLHAHWYLM